jgi:hypothetical protein
MAEPWTPDLELHERTDRCQLSLVGVTTGHGATLQDAANDLLVRVHDLGVALRRGGLRLSGDIGRVDPRVTGFLWEVGDIVSRGGDLRARIFGTA